MPTAPSLKVTTLLPLVESKPKPAMVTVAAFAGGVVALHLNKGNGTFAAMSAIPVTFQTITGLAAADYDLDGKPDIVALAAGGVFALVNQGGAVFSQFPSSFWEPYADNLASGDLDLDGKTDLVVSDRARGAYVVVVRNVSY